MYYKTVGQYEKEAIKLGACLIHPAGDIARRVYQKRHGKLASSKIFVCHTCDNPQCIQDLHHFLGSAKDNMQDAMKKGRKIHSEATKMKMRKAVRAPFTLLHIANIKAAVNRPEIKAKYAGALKGRKFTDVHKQNHAAAMSSIEVRAKLSAAQHARQADKRQFLFEEMMGSIFNHNHNHATAVA